MVFGGGFGKDTRYGRVDLKNMASAMFFLLWNIDEILCFFNIFLFFFEKCGILIM